MKLIKINTDHYIIVDDSEIKEGDYIINIQRMHIYPTPVCADDVEYRNRRNDVFKKITHSTQPIEEGTTIHGIEHKRWNHVKFIDLSEVKELIGDVDVEKRAKNHLDEQHNNEDIAHPELYDAYHSFLKGYTQALEDNKDKKYTEEDVIEFAEWLDRNTYVFDGSPTLSKNGKSIGIAKDKLYCRVDYTLSDNNCGYTTKELLQLWKEQQLKTIWGVEFDSQGKLKLKK